ncbi:MAG: sigma-70 family RNA polymerase sigma factor [Planctomycetes bacterium]|nr:sigma-70 family RNA polymerase sigma factor [Planctomycetota bacterium]MBM4085927.1 sigma-70 family RNA polymerase sigma factor [Planctomycetota bacterium]
MQLGSRPEKPQGVDDVELITRCLAGEKEAFGQLVVKYQDSVYAICLATVMNQEDAKDLTQETFIKAYLALDSLQDVARFGRWVAKIASNACMDWLRALKPQLPLTEVSKEPGTETAKGVSGVEAAAAAEENARVMAAIAALPEHYRTAFSLRYMAELSYAEIADILDVPLTTVEGRLFKAREILRKNLKDAGQ